MSANTAEIIDLSHEISKIIGQENVQFDDVTRLLYATDASNYQIIPHGVTFPRNADDVSAIHELAKKYQVPVLPRGGATSLAGQTVGRAIVIDFTRYMRRIRSVNADSQTVQVEPGMVLAQMNHQLQSLGLMFGPDPASANRATIGGCLGNNASGTHSILYRMTSNHVNWLDIVLPSGEQVRLGNHQYGTNSETTNFLRQHVAEIYNDHQQSIENNFPKTWRSCAGYGLNRLDIDDIDLAQLIIGSEGSLGTIVGVELKLVPRPKLTGLAVVHFDNMRTALESVPAILETHPSAVELMDDILIGRTLTQPKFAPRLHFVEGHPSALLIVEYYAETEDELKSSIQSLHAKMKSIGHPQAIVELYDPKLQQDVWYIRKAGLGLLASNPGDSKTVAVIEDAAVPVEHLADYIDRIREIVDDAGTQMSLYAHASAGCLHVRPMLNLKTSEGIRQYRQIGELAVDAVLLFGGTTSGEHGEGYVRGEFSERLFGQDLVQAFTKVKQTFDPDNQMNPGKIVNSPLMDTQELLRYGTDYSTPIELKSTLFNWAQYGGFAGAVEMCNGSSVCRKEDSGTMCPSFMATREEPDSTRGRANILRMAMTGKFGMDGMQDKRVKDVLDLCLSCKACKAECPTSVDMAKMKSEFISNYQNQHGIPIRSRIFANIHRLNKLGSIAPQLSNIASNLPLISKLAKNMIGIAPERDLPQFAPQRYSKWHHKQSSYRPPQSVRKINTPILLLDTFLEYYDPHIGQALHHLHQKMNLPLDIMSIPNGGCCGRPAISKGLLSQAKTMVNNLVTGLAETIEQDPHVRFMMAEPSCLSVLKDDAIELVNEQYRHMAQDISHRTLSISQWLAECTQNGYLEDIEWDAEPREIIFHGHCHQKSLWGIRETLQILQSIPNVKVTELDAGCCGMAGSFGYEAEHYDVSMTIAQQRLYPAIRQNDALLVVAPGTSCREQINHIDRTAYHPVEILALACGWRQS